MLAYVLNACRLAGVDRLVVVVGFGKELVMERFSSETELTWVEQTEQRGTGHAVVCCRDALRNFDGTVLVIAGDMPLVQRRTLSELVDLRDETGDAATIATTELDDPAGYGRILRDASGRLEGIVEDRDCSPEQRAIHEVNPSYYCFDAKRLFAALDKVQPSASKGEYYLTDAIRILRSQGHGVSAGVQVPPEDAMGINSRIDLAVVGRAMQDRLQSALMEGGVTIVDPDNTWIEADAAVGRDSVILPFTFVGGGATIGSGCRIGPFAWIAAGDVIGDRESVSGMVGNREVRAS